MKEEKLVQITTCDKCGGGDRIQEVIGLDLCRGCQDLWTHFVSLRTKDIVNAFLDANRTIMVEEFKNATLKDLQIVKKI